MVDKVDKTKEESKEVVQHPPKDQKNNKKKQTGQEDEEEQLSEEDLKLKSDLEVLVERLKENDTNLYGPSLDKLKEFIRSSTSSMTAVPKPLKFLRPYYSEMCSIYDKWSNRELKSSLAEVLSVLAMTYAENNRHDSLKFAILCENLDIVSWGHEYIRHLALEIGEVYNDQVEREGTGKASPGELQETATVKSEGFEFSKEVILQLSLKIVPYFMKHNGEADAVDLLLEIESVEKLPQFVDENTYQRVCQYMVACVPLLPQPEDVTFLQTAYSIYLSQSQLTEALLLAIRLGDESLVRSVFEATSDPIVHKQLAYILSFQKTSFEYEPVKEIIGNTKLSEHFLYLTKELNLTVPKVPEDVYKSHLDSSKSVFSGTGLDSAQQNLAAAFVNSYLNMGYCNDKMLIDNDNWIYKTKGDGMTSAVASLGSIFQWNLDGLQQLDKYLYVDETEVKAGALLGIGVSACGVHDGEVEPALLLLQDYVSNPNSKISSAAILGLGIAFAGSKNEEVLGLLLPIAADTSLSIETSAIASLALSHIFVGTCNGDITSAIMDNFLERSGIELKTEWVRFLTLALGIIYMGQGEQVDDVLETINAIEHPMTSAIEVLVSACAYAGTGDVLLIQDLLHRLAPKPIPEEEDEEEDEAGNPDSLNTISDILGKEQSEKNTGNEENHDHEMDSQEGNNDNEKKEQEENGDEHGEDSKEDSEEKEAVMVDELSYAVLGIAMIALGEDIGKEMSLRHFGHLMHYGNEQVRCMVPLAMGLVSVANPQMKVFDSLSRFSHDADLNVSMNSIYAMGLCGAGTNNARLAQLLRQLASYYSREQDALFITRLAQGLVHLGKGTMTLDIFNDAHVMNKVTLASLLTVLVGLVSPGFMLKNHQLFFSLSSAVRPKFILTLNEEGEPIKVNVRVGQAVETVGQAGKPKTITGWITQSTPVLLNHGERAELETDEYISYTNNIEGVVILRKNPEYEKEEAI